MSTVYFLGEVGSRVLKTERAKFFLQWEHSIPYFTVTVYDIEWLHFDICVQHRL